MFEDPEAIYVAVAGSVVVAIIVAIVLTLLWFRRRRRRSTRTESVRQLFLRIEAIQGELEREREEEDTPIVKEKSSAGRGNGFRIKRRSASSFFSSRGSSAAASTASSSTSPKTQEFDTATVDPSVGKEVLDMSLNVWRWTVDGEGHMSVTDECSSSAVKVLVCLHANPKPGGRGLRASGSSADLALGVAARPSMAARAALGMLPLPRTNSINVQEPYSSRSDRELVEKCVSMALLNLCRHEMCYPDAIRCCIVCDTLNIAGVLRIDTRVVEHGQKDSLVLADIIPIMCDIADYNILVIEDFATLSAVRYSSFGRIPSVSLDVSAISSSGTEESQKLTEGRIEDAIVGQPQFQRTLGASAYIVGLTALALKSERQAFVQFTGSDDDSDDQVFRQLTPYSQRSERSTVALELEDEVDGVKLHSSLLCMWATVVSHGSFNFICDAAPLLAELPFFRSHRGLLCGLLPWSWRARSEDAVSEDVLQYFHRYRQREPLLPNNHAKMSKSRLYDLGEVLKMEEEYGKKKARGWGSVRAQHMKSLKANLTLRAIIHRYARFYLKSEEVKQLKIAELGGDQDVSFTVPCNHPMAQQMWAVTRDIDYLLDQRARGVLETMEKYMSLERLAERIQGFLISYLRKINCVSDAEASHKVQNAAFELYTSGAEGQGYLVDVVCDFLCSKAEMRGYQKVTKALANELKETDDADMSPSNTAPTEQQMEGRYYPMVYVTIIGAKNLPKVSPWTADGDMDEMPTAYCTVAVEASDMVLHQTGISTQTCSPEWRELVVLTNFPQDETLAFNVWQADPVTRDRFLGRALLPAYQFEKQEFSGDLIIDSVHRRSSGPPRRTTSVVASASLAVRVSTTPPKKSSRSLKKTFLTTTSSGRQVAKSPTAGVSMTTNSSSIILAQPGNRGTQTSSLAEAYDRPRTLADQLLVITEVHRKLERVMIDLVSEAKEEAAQHGIAGSAQVDQTADRNPFWDLVEGSTLEHIERRIWPTDHRDLAKSDRAKMAQEVDDGLEAAEGDPFLVDHCHDTLNRAVAQTRVMCDSFWIMHLVMLRLEKSKRLVVHSRQSTLKERRKTPAVVYTVSLKENAMKLSQSLNEMSGEVSLRSSMPVGSYGQRLSVNSDGEREQESPKLLEVVLSHKKISAVGQETRTSVKQILSEMRTINSICRTLRLGDPDLHPSMWCLSLRQLQEFAREVEVELGADVYRAASCAEIVKKCIIRKTSAARTSYARMVNWQGLRQIDVFVSHCWGENFSVFVDSVVAALEQRIQASEVNLWICCFALYQSPNYEMVKKQVGTDLMDAPFEKALRFAREFLVVRNAECDMYQRAWCVFEIFRARQLDLKITVTGPDTFTKENVDILSCKATDKDDEQMIKGAIVDANEVDELNRVVSEIKAMGGRLEPTNGHPVVRI